MRSLAQLPENWQLDWKSQQSRYWNAIGSNLIICLLKLQRCNFKGKKCGLDAMPVGDGVMKRGSHW